jgi:hypothetical protein
VLKCKKCGAELAEGQRACLECGEVTAAGGKFDYGEEKRFELTRNHILVAIGIVLVIIIVLVARSLQTVPPEKVASEWFDALSQRQLKRAKSYITPKFEQDLAGKMMDLRAMSDECYSEVVSNNAKFEVSRPSFDNPSNPKTADITISLVYPNGELASTIKIRMIREGRRWRVDGLM